MDAISSRVFVVLGMTLISLCSLSLIAVSSARAQTPDPVFAADGVVESKSGGFMFPDGSVQNTAAAPAGTYILGGLGPAGGFVFHLTSDGMHGLEAAPVDQASAASGVAWGCPGTDIAGAAGTALGTGRNNTDDVLLGCETVGIPAALANGYVSPSGYFDWYLPSIDDLTLMYTELHRNGIGGFSDTLGKGYWSSSEFGGTSVWMQ